MLNKEVKNKNKVKMTPGHRKTMKGMFIAAFSIAAIGIILSALAWAGFIPGK